MVFHLKYLYFSLIWPSFSSNYIGNINLSFRVMFFMLSQGRNVNRQGSALIFLAFDQNLNLTITHEFFRKIKPKPIGSSPWVPAEDRVKSILDKFSKFSSYIPMPESVSDERIFSLFFPSFTTIPPPEYEKSLALDKKLFISVGIEGWLYPTKVRTIKLYCLVF